MAVLKIKQSDGTWSPVGSATDAAVKFVNQVLTEDQKAQARANIGATYIIYGTELPTTLNEGQIFGLIED